MPEWTPKKVHRWDQTKNPESTKCVTVTHNVSSIYPLSVFSLVFPLLNWQTCLITLCRLPPDLQQHLCHLHQHQCCPQPSHRHRHQHHNHNHPSVITLCRLPDLGCLDTGTTLGVMTIIVAQYNNHRNHLRHHHHHHNLAWMIGSVKCGAYCKI